MGAVVVAVSVSVSVSAVLSLGFGMPCCCGGVAVGGCMVAGGGAGEVIEDSGMGGTPCSARSAAARLARTVLMSFRICCTWRSNSVGNARFFSFGGGADAGLGSRPDMVAVLHVSRQVYSE